jgi:hypothetical protein
VVSELEDKQACQPDEDYFMNGHWEDPPDQQVAASCLTDGHYLM